MGLVSRALSFEDVAELYDRAAIVCACSICQAQAISAIDWGGYMAMEHPEVATLRDERGFVAEQVIPEALALVLFDALIDSVARGRASLLAFTPTELINGVTSRRRIQCYKDTAR